MHTDVLLSVSLYIHTPWIMHVDWYMYPDSMYVSKKISKHACMYVCMYAHDQVCIYVCMYVCMYHITSHHTTPHSIPSHPIRPVTSQCIGLHRYIQYITQHNIK